MVANLSDTKRCPRCGHSKPLTAFHRNRWSLRDGRDSYCVACSNKQGQRPLANAYTDGGGVVAFRSPVFYAWGRFVVAKARYDRAFDAYLATEGRSEAWRAPCRDEMALAREVMRTNYDAYLDRRQQHPEERDDYVDFATAVGMREAAGMLGVSYKTATHWCNRGQLAATKIGDRWAVSREAVERWARTGRLAHRAEGGR